MKPSVEPHGPIRRCQSSHECCMCDSPIVLGQQYIDGGYGKRAHYPACPRGARLQGPAGGARGEADARACDAGTPQSTGVSAKRQRRIALIQQAMRLGHVGGNEDTEWLIEQVECLESDLLAALQQAQATIQKLQSQKIDLAMRCGQILGPEWDGEPFDKLARKYVEAQATIQRLEQEYSRRRQTILLKEAGRRLAAFEAELTAAQATIPHLQATVAQRGEDLQWLIEQVEPTLLAQHRHKGDPYETCEARACARVREIKARLAALLSAIPAPRAPQEEETKEDLSRVGPLTAGAAAAGSTAEDRTGNATAAKRTERMPACATCGHAWGEHARPPDVDADVDDGKRWCFALTDHGECRCQNYEER